MLTMFRGVYLPASCTHSFCSLAALFISFVNYFVVYSQLLLNFVGWLIKWLHQLTDRSSVCNLYCSELSSGLYCRVKWLSTDVSEGWIIHPWWWRQHVPLKRRSTIILHGSTTQKTALNIILAAVRTCISVYKLNSDIPFVPNNWT
jgi:hypothetical protein